MLAESIAYSRSRRSRSAIYAANRFVRFVDDRPAASLDDAAINLYRERCRETSLSPATIESSINYLAALARAHGATISYGQRIAIDEPEPKPTPISDIDAIWPHMPPWLQQWLILSYWTCLRLSDAVRLQLAIDDGSGQLKALRMVAGKTRRRHVYPVTDWLRRYLVPVPVPYRSAGDFASKRIRRELTTASEQAGIERLLPLRLRQRAITEWNAADSLAGAIIHGCGGGILKHYVDPLRILESAQHRVRLPTCFGAGDSSGCDIATTFQRLDPEAQTIVRSTMRRLA